MKKIYQRFSVILALTLVLGALAMGSAAAKLDDGWQLPKTEAARTQSLTVLTLQESLDGSNWIQTVLGDLVGGYTMALSGTAGAMEYLDVASLAADPAVADGLYPFILDVNRLPTAFYPYWAAQGVTASAATGTWEAVMWQIINGQLPIFYLRVANGETHLIDGLAWQTQGLVLPVRVSADYPLHTYNFQGTVTFVGGTTQTLVLGISYTHQATVELRVAGVEPAAIVIDGCGYVDVTIRLNNVEDDLFALDLSITFEPALVEVVDLDTATTPINLAPIAPWAAHVVQNVAYNVDDPTTPLVNEAGTIRLISSLYNTETPVNGSFDVATMRLRAKNLGTSKIGFSLVELSDREGYLIGAPYILGGPNTDFSYPVTTQFTTAGGLDLLISRVDAETVRLSWPINSMDTVSSYKLYRSSIPYFTPVSGTEYQVITNDGTSTTASFLDDDNLGTFVNHNFYSLKVACVNGFESPASWQVGKYENRLFETSRTDYTWVGVVLELPSVSNTLDLSSHIQQNSSNTVAVRSVRIWNNVSQTLSLYLNDPEEDQASVLVNYPYQVEIDIAGTTNGSLIWDQVGRLPEITTDTYTLRETSRTDYSWVLQPLYMTSIHDTDMLIYDIENNTSGPLTVRSVRIWNGLAQTYSLYLPGEDSGVTSFGMPYQVDVDIVGSNPVTWP